MAWHNAEMDPLPRQPQRPSRKKQAQRGRVLAFYALLALFVIAGAVLAIRMFGYSAARDEYAAYQAADIHADVPFETTVPEQTTMPEAVARLFRPPRPQARPQPPRHFIAKRSPRCEMRTATQ